MKRRGFFGHAAGAAIAGPRIASDVAQGLAQPSIGGNIPFMGEAPCIPLDPRGSQLAKLERGITHTKQMRQAYTMGLDRFEGIDVLRRYPDVMELRSVSPAAKRIIAMDRYIAEQESERTMIDRLRQSLGLDKLGWIPWWRKED